MWTASSLAAHLSAGNTVDFLFFWGHTPKIATSIDASCLSQWFPRAFSVDGVTYASAEHFMMAAKARLFSDEEALEKILAAATPAEAKALGREVRNFDGAKWASARVEAVVRGNVAKFGGHADLRASNPTEWCGLNLLGFALVEARERLLRASGP